VVWEDSFTELANQISVPGGTAWEGSAADAAFASAHADRMIVIGLADELHAAAQIARTGANQIDYARSAVLRVVDAAEAAGFVVAEDFSVTCPGLFDPITAAARQAQAEAIATELRATVGTLVAADTEVAAGLIAATGGVGNTVFPESEDAASSVQLVDYKTAPPTEPSPSPTPSPSPSWPPAPLDPEELTPFNNQGDVMEKAGEQAKKHASGRAAETWGSFGRLGKYLGRLGVLAELGVGVKEIQQEINEGKSVKDAVVDVAPKTVSGIAGSWAGTTIGAAQGAVGGAAAGGMVDKVLPMIDGEASKVIGGVVGAAGGALVGGIAGGDIGEAIGEALSDGLREVLD
jgi:hypothetical protein